jgi:hypothetical protein
MSHIKTKLEFDALNEAERNYISNWLFSSLTEQYVRIRQVRETIFFDDLNECEYAELDANAKSVFREKDRLIKEFN